MELIDTHCHLPDEEFDADRNQVLAHARAAGVTGILLAGTGPADWPAYLALSGKEPALRVALGVHPNRAKDSSVAALKELKELLQRHRGRAVAVGEIGLDFFRDHATPEEQRGAFQAQLELAAELDLPVILHCRAAEAALLEMLRAESARRGRLLRGVWHSFSATPAQAEEAVALGLHLAFNGILTYPKAEAVREAARQTPPDRLLLETDAPYLAPQPWRGKRNEPAYVAETARRLAEVRGVALEELARQTTQNARKLFAAW